MSHRVTPEARLNLYGVSHPERFASPNSHWSKRYMTWLATVPMETASGRAMLIHEVEEMRRIQLAVNLKSSELSLTPAYAENFRLISSIPDLISSLKNTIFIRKSFILQAESISHLN